MKQAKLHTAVIGLILRDESERIYGWNGTTGSLSVACFSDASHAKDFAREHSIEIVEEFDRRPVIEFIRYERGWHASSPYMEKVSAEAWAEARGCRAVFK